MSATIYLDPDDVVGSIKAKVEQAAEERVTLVAPYGMASLLNPVNLELLRRYIEGMGLKAVLVSRDARLRGLARAAGMRVGAGEPAGAEEVLRSGKAYAAYQQEIALLEGQRRLTSVAAIAGISLAVGLPLVAALALAPSAAVVVYPETVAFEETVQVRASALMRRADPVAVAVPGQLLQVDFQVTESLDIAASAVAPARAQGRIVVTNLTNTPVDIPTGVQVSTSTGTVYATQSAFTLLPNQAGAVTAVSRDPGAAGNAPPGAIDRFVGGPFPSLTVTNPDALTGGRDQSEARVSEDHHRQLREKAIAGGRDEALRRLVRERTPGQSFYDDAVVLRYGNDELSPQVGAVSQQATLKLNGHARVMAFRGEDVNGVLRRRAASLGDTQLLDGTFSTTPLELLRSDPEEVVFHMQVKGERGPRLAEDRVKELVRGKQAREAEELLKQVPLVGRARVEIWPFWATGVSSLPWRITVRQGVQ